MKGDINVDDGLNRIREPLIIPSPLSTISQTTGAEAIKELHVYIRSVLAAMRTSKDESSRVTNSLLREDDKLLSAQQVFRPMKGQGIGLHYRFIRDRASLGPLVQLVIKASKVAPSTATRGIEGDVAGVILCVGMAGLPSAYAMSSLQYSLGQRMRDCVEVLTKGGSEDTTASLTLISTVLLADDESRLTNSMASADDYLLFAESDDPGKPSVKKKQQEIPMDGEFDNPLSVNSADQARIMVERLAVLSVVESDTIFRKFEGRVHEKSKSRRRKAGKDADLDGFDFRGEKKSSREVASVAPSDDASVKSSASSMLQLRQPKKDTARIANGSKSRNAVPALMASNKDTGGARRHRPTNNSRRQSTQNIQADRGATDGGDGNAFGSAFGTTFDSGSVSTSNNFDPFATSSIGTASTASETVSSSKRNMGAFDNGFGGDAFDFGAKTRSPPPAVDGQRVQINVALNEDLTCFYKLSRMSSCTVEGVVQVQIKTSLNEAGPFSLSIKDPSSHIQSIQENKKFAQNDSASLESEPRSRRPDHRYIVNVPKGDNYFPVMRYKCGNELRPVPIVRFFC